jgi:hypothetical protein
MIKALRDQLIAQTETARDLQSQMLRTQDESQRRLLKAQLEQAWQRRQEIADELDALT